VIIGGSEGYRDFVLLEEGADRGGRFIVDVEVKHRGVA
jgi:hypothetical protein